MHPVIKKGKVFFHNEKYLLDIFTWLKTFQRDYFYYAIIAYTLRGM